MKSTGFILSALLFFSPLLAQNETPIQKKPVNYAKTGAKIVSALAKTTSGLGLIGFFTYAAILAINDSPNFKATWVTIETELSSGKLNSMEKFNILPAWRTFGVIVYIAAIASGGFSLYSAANDLQSLNKEVNE